MYPVLLVPLLAGVTLATAALLWIAWRYPFLRRLAGRQLRRRRTEAILVVAGSLLGTTMIVSSLVVGDTLDHSVRGVAYDTLGPVDERVVSLDPRVGEEAARRLEPIAHDSRVDGLLTMRTTQGAALRHAPGGDRAEPRTLIWEADFAAAAAFGGTGSGLTGRTPEGDDAVINEELAASLGVRAGDDLVIYPFASAAVVHVVGVIPAEGLGGLGPRARNPVVYVAPGTLDAAARFAGRGAPTWVTFVSNRGGVESGATLTASVRDRIEDLLGGLSGASVETPKRDVLDSAEETGAVLGSLFLFISSFSIIAGILLLVNVFVMLADERRSEIGMLRAMGLKRGRLVGALVLEGSVYAFVAAIAGVGLGILVGSGVVVIAAKVFETFGSAFGDITFAVTPTSLVNGAAMGFLIAFLTVLVASTRISRMNVIAAIRDLDSDGIRTLRRRTLVLCAIGVVTFGATSAQAVAQATGPMTYALPALTVLFAVPLLARRLPKRLVYSVAALLVLGWGLVANLVRPDVFDNPTSTTYVVLGTMLAFSAVVLIAENQHVLLRPFRRFIRRPSEGGLAARLAVAYPTAKRFRTGATLAMYSIVVLMLVMITQIGAVMMASVDAAVHDAGGRYDVRADFAVAPRSGDPVAALRDSAVGADIAAATALRTVTATSDDPGGRWTSPVPVVAVGLGDVFAREALRLDKRLAQYADDAAAWQALVRDPTLVIVSMAFATTGGPLGDAFGPGDTVTVTDPRTGRAVPRTIAATLRNDFGFDSMTAAYTYPVLMADAAVRQQFGAAAELSSVFLTLRPGVDPEQFATRVQADLISNGARATAIENRVRDLFAANLALFRLMQGFLALGLVVGITGLGVVMVRAVRERRRTIGVLRALGFRSRTVRRAFLAESTLVAVEGIVSGAVLALLTSWLLFTNSPAFGSIEVAFPIAWAQLGLIVGVTFFASLLATVGPANRAAAIRPARALRISD